ncbi:hypothetical protein [Phaeocystidibacter marisrubri]|uniref:Outer membrane beta-barrel protein n=1 Tax=Phaeocystidibacter marisrubri TaxID=1577780 RepID=A0A6L3ZJ84_9FLAO|nr:hypothetical protein [Phaeocystidibacter marisrubri]KAB2817994.1 hypothetical protein F8C82_06210 [Phaeocystidibacter marisrubri]
MRATRGLKIVVSLVFSFLSCAGNAQMEGGRLGVYFSSELGIPVKFNSNSPPSSYIQWSAGFLYAKSPRAHFGLGFSAIQSFNGYRGELLQDNFLGLDVNGNFLVGQNWFLGLGFKMSFMRIDRSNGSNSGAGLGFRNPLLVCSNIQRVFNFGSFGIQPSAGLGLSAFRGESPTVFPFPTVGGRLIYL